MMAEIAGKFDPRPTVLCPSIQPLESNTKTPTLASRRSASDAGHIADWQAICIVKSEDGGSLAANPLLSVRNLTVSFGGRTAIRDLNFDVHTGDTLAIIGPNGSGKTVLLKALLKLVPYEGNIFWLAGVRLGYVPQKIAADRQMPLLVRDLLKAKAHFLNLPPRDIELATDQVGMTSEVLNAGIGVISGGQFQKVLIAYALLGKPNVLLFDEPTASLDELEEERIYELLEQLQKQQSLTILLVSHDLSIVYRSANRVLCLSKGGSCIGPPKEILTPEMLETMYSAPKKYYQHRQHRQSIEGEEK
jgi:zinc transport system ATP-binding protein